MRWLLFAVALGLAPLAHAEDWPTFLGSHRDSSCTLEIQPWKDALKPLWTAAVGEGHSSPIVQDGVVYLFFKLAKKEEEALAAYDLKSGAQKWVKSYPREKFTNPFGNGPRGTPTVDGGFVYTYGCTGLLTAFAVKDGAIAWQLDTLKEFKLKNLFFGVSTSVTVVADNVIVMAGGKGSGIIAVNKLTGKVAWTATDDRPSYASPVLSTGKDPVLVFLTGDTVRALHPADGKEVWAYPFVDGLMESSTSPVQVGELFVAGSIKNGCVALKPGVGTPTAVWRNPKLTCYFSTPVAVSSDLYMINGEAKFPGGTITLRCVDSATGEVRWEKPNMGSYHAAILQTKNNLLLVQDDKGDLSLIQPDAKEYRELARCKVCGFTWAHPAVVDGKYLIRDNGKLYCYDLSATR